MSTTTDTSTGQMPLVELITDLDGELTLPGAPDWDRARAAWHLDVDQQPAAVVEAASARDVVLVVEAAQAAGLRVAAQSTGHNAGPLGNLSGTVLVRMHRMRQVQIDPVNHVARAEGGAVWADVTAAAAPHGLAALAGSAADVGVAGYSLGGGVSWLGRSHGLTANSVLALEVVTADGELRRVDETCDPELFWALRGGGGAFGVVTAIEMRLFPIAEVHAGTLFFPLERASEVLHAWHDWTASVPESVTSIGRVLRFPPMPELPDFLSGQSFAVVEAACQLSVEEADELLAPLRELGPTMDTFATIPVETLDLLHMDPPGPVPGRGDGALLDEVSHATIDALLAVAGPGVESPLLSVELRHLDGMLAPGRMAGGATSGLPGTHLMFAVGITPFPEAVVAVEQSVTAVRSAVEPWETGCYLNFAETPRTGDEVFFGSHDRLRRVKWAYDPTDVFHSNHPIEPAGL
jgi:hypothetical protein